MKEDRDRQREREREAGGLALCSPVREVVRERPIHTVPAGSSGPFVHLIMHECKDARMKSRHLNNRRRWREETTSLQRPCQNKAILARLIRTSPIHCWSTDHETEVC